MSIPRPVLALATLLFAATAAAPAAADWLVLRDGSRLEIAGAWKAQGNVAVFKLPNGTLSSVRLSELDTAASAEATAQAVADRAKPSADKAPPPAARKSVRALTDADFGRAEPAPGETPEAETGGEGTAPAAGAQTNELVVTTWEQATTDGVGLAITGTLVNRGQEVATDVGLEVVIFDVNGERLSGAPATLDRNVLPVGGETAFRIAFPGVFGLTSAKFNITYRSFDKREEPPPPAPGQASS